MQLYKLHLVGILLSKNRKLTIIKLKSSHLSNKSNHSLLMETNKPKRPGFVNQWSPWALTQEDRLNPHNLWNIYFQGILDYQYNGM